MPRPGREFEKLVARIEEKLCPMGATVISPDRIPELVSGNLREVDASIRFKLGSVPILITIECRDRGAVQDVTWLEQIKSKKESIGANQTIAVSKEGFTDGARSYANQHGILLRQLSELTDSFILQCIQGTRLFVRDTRCHMRYYNIGYFPLPEDEGSTELSLAEDSQRAIIEGGPFATNRDGEPITLEELYKETLPEIKAQINEHVDEENGFNAQSLIEGDAEIDAIFEPDSVLVETVRGPRFISVIIFGVHYEVSNEAMSCLKPMGYVDERGKLIDSFATTTDENHTIRINMKFGWDQ